MSLCNKATTADAAGVLLEFPPRQLPAETATPTSALPLGRLPAAHTSPMAATAAAAAPHLPTNPVPQQPLAPGPRPPTAPVPQLPSAPTPILSHGPFTAAAAGTSAGEVIPPPGPLPAARGRTRSVSAANNNGAANLCAHSSTTMIHPLTCSTSLLCLHCDHLGHKTFDLCTNVAHSTAYVRPQACNPNSTTPRPVRAGLHFIHRLLTKFHHKHLTPLLHAANLLSTQDLLPAATAPAASAT